MSHRRRSSAAICILATLAILGSPEGTLMAADSAQRLREIVANLPEQIEGRQKADSEIYTPDNLYRYINGGAELYISFQFATLISQPYIRADGVEIRLDIFDMDSAASAFGVFCHSREAVDDFVTAEVESEYAGGLLHFWKGRYYVSLLAYPETESGRNLVRELARGTAAQIEEESRRPAVVALLPEVDMVAHSERYFRHHAWLNDYHSFGDGNVLQLGGEAEVAMGRYRPDGTAGKSTVLLAARYPDAAAAAAANENFTNLLLPTAEDGLHVTEDGSWLGCRLVGNTVIVVAAAPDRATADGLLLACAQRCPAD